MSKAGTVDQGCGFRQGDRVRLAPFGRSDICDLSLSGRTGTVEAVELDYEDRFYVVVTVDDAPEAGVGRLCKPGHSFFLRPDELSRICVGNRGVGQ